MGLTAEQPMMHEAARLNDPYAAANIPNDDGDKDEGGVSPTQPFPEPRRVTFLDTLDSRDPRFL